MSNLSQIFSAKIHLLQTGFEHLSFITVSNRYNGSLRFAIIANELMLIITCWVVNELTLYYRPLGSETFRYPTEKQSKSETFRYPTGKRSNSKMFR